MYQGSLGLALILILAGSACGRINFDPVALTADQDADTLLIDAALTGDDASPNCNAAAVTGSYVGDGVSARIIDTGVQPVLVIVQSDAGEEAVIRMATMPINLSKSLVGAQLLEREMIAHASNGFAVGGDSRVNQLGQTYHWLALPLSAGIGQGQYTGTASAQSISGLGFRPQWILFADEGDGAAVMHMPQPASLTFRLDDGTGVTDGVTSLDADGFSLGGRPFVNALDHEFHYVAWRSTPGSIDTKNYVGDNANGRILSGLGFTPAYVMIHTPNSVVLHRFQSLPIGQALPVIAQTPIAQAIIDFAVDGFSVGSLPGVNEFGAEYTYSAFATCP